MDEKTLHYTDFGIMTLAHKLAELHCQLNARVDDEESIEIMARAATLMIEAEKLLGARWEWSKANPPKILRRV